MQLHASMHGAHSHAWSTLASRPAVDDPLCLQMTIGNLKLKLFTLIGTSPPNMRLVLLVSRGGKRKRGQRGLFIMNDLP